MVGVERDVHFTKAMLHKFRSHQINPDTKILILGTFQPDIENGIYFFHSQKENCLWQILPACFSETSLRGQSPEFKKDFIRRKQVDFADIIASLRTGSESRKTLYNDVMLDQIVDQWNKTEEMIDGLRFLEAVYFIRKTFHAMPRIEKRILQIRNHCVRRCMRFSLLKAPGRYADQEKIDEWTSTIIHKTICR